MVEMGEEIITDKRNWVLHTHTNSSIRDALYFDLNFFFVFISFADL